MNTTAENQTNLEDAAKMLDATFVGNSDTQKFAMKYGEDLWKFRNDVFKALDEKADSIIKYLGGGTGLFALGVIAKADTSNAWLIKWVLPSLVLAILSVGFAIWARFPKETPGLPSVKDLVIGYLDKVPDEMSQFVWQWHYACVHMKIVCDNKGWWIMLSSWAYCGAIACLCLPVVVIWLSAT